MMQDEDNSVQQQLTKMCNLIQKMQQQQNVSPTISPIFTINLQPMPCHSSSTPYLLIHIKCILPCLCGNSHSIMLPTLINSKGELTVNVVEVSNINANNNSTVT
eukprot:8044602-Ditylum_brightwellii.AAC.1